MHLSLLRGIILFALGIAVIIDALVLPGRNVAELTVGLILLGMVSFESIVTQWFKVPKHKKDDTIP